MRQAVYVIFNLLVMHAYGQQIKIDSGDTKEALDLLAPKRIYTTVNDVDTRGIDQRRQKGAILYLDRMLFDVAINPGIRFENTETQYAVYSAVNYDSGHALTTQDIEKHTLDVTVIGGSNYQDTVFSFEHVSAKESTAEYQFPKILCIGDSVTDQYLAGQNVPSGSPSSFWAVIKDEFEKAKVDNSDKNFDCLLLGRKSGRSWYFNYREVVNRKLKAFAEGQGGWRLANHLHHTDERPYQQGVWDLLGLGDGSGKDFINNEPQRNKINLTTEGLYRPINTASFILFMNMRYGDISNFEDALLKAEFLLENPVNPFFDRSKIESGYGFSLKKYLDRFKTLSSDGQTRLEIEKAGSLVIDVNAYDVTIPTHIVIQHSHNEGNSPVIAKNYRTITNIITEEALQENYGDIKIGLSILGFTGTYFPELYPDFINPLRLNDYTRSGYHNLKRLYSEFWIDGANEDEKGIFIIPTFHIMPTAYSQPYRFINNGSTNIPTNLQQKVVNGIAPHLHPNGIGHQAIGHQLFSWIVYTSK